MKKILYFDCFAGIAGDMTVGALLDLGINEEQFLQELKKLNIGGYQIQIQKKIKNGLSGTDFKVLLTDAYSHHHQEHYINSNEEKSSHHQHTHRNLHDVEEIIEKSSLNKRIKELSKEIFKKVALAESKIHGKPLEEVHFHEVGAIDSIVDIVGTAICIDLLDIDEIYASPLPGGTGFVECAHGIFPIPAPATLEILKGVPIYSNGMQSELVTPTGAAIIKTLARDFISIPHLTIKEIGYGLGDRDMEIPNVLRVILGEKKAEEALILLESNIDDMNPEYYSYLFPHLLEHGAVDVYLIPIIMKKNRPANILSVLCPGTAVKDIEEILFKETTTLGIRRSEVNRDTLEREFKKIHSRFGQVTIKIALQEGKVLKYTPEYEECKEIAQQQKIPIREVYQQIITDAEKQLSQGEGSLIHN